VCFAVSSGDGDVCGGVDRCWSHDNSAVNSSLCYYPCTASTTTSSSAPRSSNRLCTTQRHGAPSVEHRRPSSAPWSPPPDGAWSAGDRAATATPLVASSEAPRPRCLPLLCLVGVAAALLAAAAAQDRLRDRGERPRVRLERRRRDFPAVTSRRDVREFPLPVVNDVVCQCADCRRADAGFSRSPLWTATSVRRRGKLGTRTTIDHCQRQVRERLQ